MKALARRAGILHIESVALDAIAAQFGTPCYVYSRAALESAYGEFASACAGRDALVCYAVKANSNLAILDLLARRGAGFDIVSGGELQRVIAAGGDPGKTIFSGVGKTETEMRLALEAGILCFNVESEPELRRLDRVAQSMGCRAPVSLRVNPDVDPETHPYIATGLRENKFGIPADEAMSLYREAARMSGIALTGIDCHIGSQLTETEPFLEAMGKVLGIVDRLAAEGIPLAHVDLGGGLGIRYHHESPPEVREYLEALFHGLGARKVKLVLEPGRALVGNAGVLLTRVEYLKEGPDRSFAIVDAAMNDLLRPALYHAWHEVVPVADRPGEPRSYDIVGPVCETGDWLAKERELNLRPGDLLAILSAGAYGMSMSSNYNSRPRAAEVMVDGSTRQLVRERESVPELFSGEHRLRS